MQQRIRATAPPDRHHQRIRDELRIHLGFHRPADDAARKQVDYGGDVEPALGCPDIGEVGDPFTVGLVRRKLAIEHIRRDRRSRTFAIVLWQSAPARPRPQRLSAHQAFDLVQTARKACFQHVAPDPTCAIGACACHEARPYRRHDRFVLSRARAEAAFQPSMEARPRYAERFAKPCHRPDGTVLRNEAELHVDSLAK